MKKIVAGNWKMNLNRELATTLVKQVCANTSSLADNVDIIFCPPFVYLEAVRASIANNFHIGAQDIYCEKNGAFTGEISASQLLDFGCRFVIVGHSERRYVIGETDEIIGKKLKCAIENSLVPIFCIGEKLDERQNGKTFQVLENQIDKGLAQISNEKISELIIAYEPVWAIGTGQNATPEQAQEAHSFVRKKTGVKRILYGGSVNTSNCQALSGQKDIDGFLVGGASLKSDLFTDIIRSCVWKPC